MSIKSVSPKLAPEEALLTPFAWRRPTEPNAYLWANRTFSRESLHLEGAANWLRIEEGEKQETKWLVLSGDADEFGAPVGQPYEPLTEYPQLFRTFIDVEPSPEGFLRFAQEYGRLGVSREVGPRSVFRELGEALYLWRREQAHLRAADLVAQALRKRGRDLSRWFTEQTDTKVKGYRLVDDFIPREFLPSGLGVLGRLELRRSVAPPLVWRAIDAVSERGHKLRVVAAHWLAREINARLDGPISRVGVHIAARLKETASVPLRLRPDSLLAALWLQLVEAINGNRKFRRCRFHPIAEGGFGSVRKESGCESASLYCSPGCRLRDWRSQRNLKGKRR